MTAMPVPPRPPPRGRRRLRWYLLGFLSASVLLGVLYTLFVLRWSYSEGERAGVLQKFSQKGWICKTHEGELAMYVVAGVAPQIWDFSVRDDAVAAQLRKEVGQHVRVHYTEHRGVPSSCFGDTGYFVDAVEVTPAPLLQPVPSAPPPP
jgi:hypothetical protein